MKTEPPVFRTSDLRHLEKLVQDISGNQKNAFPTTWRSFYATQIFSKFSLHLTSAVRLLPSDTKDIVDVSALAAIARMIIEAHHALLYFTQRGVSTEEFDFRLALHSYHHSLEASNVLKGLGFTDENECLEWAELARIGGAHKLEKTKYFQNISPKEQKVLLKGKSPYYWRGKRPSMPYLSSAFETALYKLLSNHVHSFPLGASFKFNGANVSPLSQTNTAFLVIETIITYSASTIQQFIQFRWKLGKLVENDKKYISSLLHQNPLQQWLKNLESSG